MAPRAQSATEFVFSAVEALHVQRTPEQFVWEAARTRASGKKGGHFSAFAFTSHAGVGTPSSSAALDPDDGFALVTSNQTFVKILGVNIGRQLG